MFAQQLRRIDFSRVVPFGEEDLLLVCDKKIGFRLSNIISEKGQQFTIKHFMDVSSRKKLKKEQMSIFGKKLFASRYGSFKKGFQDTLERYFDNEKTNYLFFDKAEQDFLRRKVFFKRSFSCIVYICINDEEGNFEEVDITELTVKEANKVLHYMSTFHVREVLTPREAYAFRKSISKIAREARKKFNARMSQRKVDRIKFFMDRYKKLNQIKTKKQYKKYFRALMAKYHPDKGGEHDIFVLINEDNKEIQMTSWYNSLE